MFYKLLIPFSIAILSCTYIVAQPTLTSATNNPVLGEAFTWHYCKTEGITAGAAGAGITWDYSHLADTAQDTSRFVACSTTPYCDSFSGADLATVYDSMEWVYYFANTSGFGYLGYISYGQKEHYRRPYHFYFDSAITYNIIQVDTNIMFFDSISVPGTSDYYGTIDSFICDGYGTLILPTGTFDNVLRIHKIEYQASYDTIPAHDATPGFFVSKSDYWYWLTPDYHDALLYMGSYDPGHLFSVTYSSNRTTAVPSIRHSCLSMHVFPIPATDAVHITFNIDDATQTTIKIFSVTGKEVGAIQGVEIVNGVNDISYPVANLPQGVYFVSLEADGQKSCQKFIVGR